MSALSFGLRVPAFFRRPARTATSIQSAAPSASGLPLSVRLLLDPEQDNNDAVVFVGPVRAALAPSGAGRGLVASRDMRSGELLLACPPLAVLRSEEDGRGRSSRPHPADLVDVVLDACWEAAAAAASEKEQDLAPLAWLLTLHAEDDGDDGGGGGGGATNPPPPPEPILPLLEPPGAATLPEPALAAARAALAEWRAAAASKEKKNKMPPHASAPPWLQRRAAAVVKANAVGEAHGDLAAALAAHEHKRQRRHGDGQEGEPVSSSATAAAAAEAAAGTTRGHVCLFPAFSLLNHDCAPNAVHLTLRSGGLVVVRATRALREGEPISISYLGRPQLRPLGERRLALRSGYGFECACARCAREEAALAEAGWGELVGSAAADRKNKDNDKKAASSSSSSSPARQAAAEAAAAAETLAVRAEGEWAPDARWAARTMLRLMRPGDAGPAPSAFAADGNDDEDEEEDRQGASSALSTQERAALRQRALRTAARVARVAGGASRALLETAALAARGGSGGSGGAVGGGARALRHELAASAYAALEAAADAEAVLFAEAERKWRRRVAAASKRRGRRGGSDDKAAAADVAAARSAAGAASARAAALALCASALEGVSAGSDLHCAVTAQRCAALEVWREAAECGRRAAAGEGEGDGEAAPMPPAPPPPALVEAARAARHRAHVARYGDDVPPEFMDLLIRGSLEMYA